MRVLLALVLWLLVEGDATAAERKVKCRIDSQGSKEYAGLCRFTADASGSFDLSHPAGDKPLYDSITQISVAVTAPGVAEVRGLTRDGINSRWGEARRSKRDKACWEGSDFRVCAW